MRKIDPQLQISWRNGRDLSVQRISRDSSNSKRRNQDKSDSLSTRSISSSEMSGVDDPHVKQLQEKLHQTNARLYEAQNNCMILRQELKKAQKLLCDEVGDSVTIASLSTSGWRGRNFQIQQLQQKVTELQNKLLEQEKCSPKPLELKTLSGRMNLARERREKIEAMEKQIQETQHLLEMKSTKLKSANLRMKALENELYDAKVNLKILEQQKAENDQLIEDLNIHLKAIEDGYKSRESEIVKQHQKLQEDYLNLKNELHLTKCHADKLQMELEQQDSQFDTIRGVRNDEERRWTRENTFVEDADKYVILNIAGEAEREKLLELIATLNHRIEKEKNTTATITESLRLEKATRAELEGKLRKLESEILLKSPSE